MSKIRLENISFGYDEKNILEEISATIKSNEITCIIGPNGTGKSTLIKCMARIFKPRAGKVMVKDRDVFSYSQRELARIQAYVSQQEYISYPITVRDMVQLGRRPYVTWNLTKRDDEIIDEVMEFMSVSQFEDRLTSSLSGGEFQKVIIARALAQMPEILLLDEPTSALDLKHQLQVMEILEAVVREKNCTVVIIMHDINLAMQYCDHLIVLHEGRIYDSGKPKDVITKNMIEEVYKVEVEILETSMGLQIMPIKSIK